MVDGTPEKMSREKRILLVEDNPHDADLTRIGFKRNHIANPIMHVKNGEEALEYLFCRGRHSDRDPCELPLAVILDLKLPKVSGLEVLKQLRGHEATRQLPVIVLTSSNEAQDTSASSELGVTAYVQKPVSFLDFELAVKEISQILARLSETPSDCLVMEA